MLKMTKIKLEFIAGPQNYMVFGKITRGGISYILIDIAKSTIHIWNLMTQNKNQNKFFT